MIHRLLGRSSWGNDWDASKCNTAEGGAGATTPVGKYSPAGDSFYTAAEMAGNVLEWCADWYDENYYKNSPRENAKGPDSGQSKVLRGGSWNFYLRIASGAYRTGFEPDFRFNYIGFRCARGSATSKRPGIDGSTLPQKSDGHLFLKWLLANRPRIW